MKQFYILGIALLAIIVFVVVFAKKNVKNSDTPPLTKEPTEMELKMDLINLDKPKPNEVIKNPLTLEGSARGFWFFEASFPIRLLDANGKQIAISHAESIGNWMTIEMVPFRARLEFTAPTTDTGTLVLEKDNPSGLPENADEIRIPIRFK